MRSRLALYVASASLVCLLAAPVQAQNHEWRSNDRDYKDRYSDDDNYDVWYYTDEDDENLRRDLQRRDVDRDRERQQFSSPTHRSATDMDDRGWRDWDARDRMRHSDERSQAWRYDRDEYDYHTEDHLSEDMKSRDVDRKQQRYNAFSNPAIRGATRDRDFDRRDYDYDRGYDYDSDRYDYESRYDRAERRHARARDLDRDKEREDSWSNPAFRSATEPKEWRGDYYDNDSRTFNEGYDYDYRAYDYNPNRDYNDYEYDRDYSTYSSQYETRDPDQDAERHVFQNRSLRGATDLGQRKYDTNRWDRNEIDTGDNNR